MKNKNHLIVIAAVVGLVLALAACSPASADLRNTNLYEQSIETSATQPEMESEVVPVEIEVETSSEEIVEAIEVSSVSLVSSGNPLISQEEIDGLVFMREEEKLAIAIESFLYEKLNGTGKG